MQRLNLKQIYDLKWHNARMIHHVRKTKSLLMDTRSAVVAPMIEVQMELMMSKIFEDNLALAQRLHAHVIAEEESNRTVSTENYSLKRHRPSSSYDGNSIINGTNLAV